MTTTAIEDALAALPDGLRDPLIVEYQSIVQNFMERRWGPTELSGGRFCEIVYTVLDGHAKGVYASRPSKPRNFVDACRQLEQNTGVPRSFKILIPRFLPALYEIRNNRNVGHVGGDIDPNHMDSVAVLSTANWVMAELVRVLHDVSMDDAQAVVDAIAERRIPIVWQIGEIKRVLDPNMKLPNQILVLVASAPRIITVDELFTWTECSSKNYLRHLLGKLHSDRKVEFDRNDGTVAILPPGTKHVESVLAKYV